MIKIAIVDDNSVLIDQFCDLLDKHFKEEKNINKFDNSVDFFNCSNKYSYDMVFLDIDMPDINGFEIAENLKLIKPNIVIIFISNHDQLMCNSFEYEPLGFIRKSCLEEDLKLSLKIYKKKFKKSEEVFFLNTTNGIEKNISLDDIIYFESIGHNLYVRTINEKYTLKRERNNEQSIRKLAIKYEKNGFIQVHRSFLVNYKFIYIIKRTKVELKNQEKIAINFRKTSEIKTIYQKFLIGE